MGYRLGCLCENSAKKGFGDFDFKLSSICGINGLNI
ncbi:hypothetical protein T06_10180 [Trichinella sp. T6]|nr:hypothetical protein T06_10180 [Trichinella sp. T6]